MNDTPLTGRPVAVVGGAIGGAAAALLLARAGARVTLFERVAEPKAVGAGILLQPNGLAVLYGLGLQAALAARAWRITRGIVADAAGRPLVEAPLPDFGHGLDHALVVRRSHLFEVLLDAVAATPGITARFGVEVQGAGRDGVVTFVAGDRVGTLRADLVVGADGIRSVVRAHGDFGGRVRRGVHYVRGLGAPLPLDGIAEYWTALGIFGASPLGDGTYFYASAGAPPLAAALARRDLAAFQAAWRDALPHAGRVIGTVARFEDLLVNQVERVDCARYADGRCVLLGDAAHAMSPNLGQGANSALVDAAVLAAELRAAGALDAALERYDARRRPAVKRVQDTADVLARLGELRQPVLRHVRDTVVRLVGRLSGAERAARAAQQEDPAWLRDVAQAA